MACRTGKRRIETGRNGGVCNRGRIVQRWRQRLRGVAVVAAVGVVTVEAVEKVEAVTVAAVEATAFHARRRTSRTGDRHTWGSAHARRLYRTKTRMTCRSGRARRALSTQWTVPVVVGGRLVVEAVEAEAGPVRARSTTCHHRQCSLHIGPVAP